MPSNPAPLHHPALGQGQQHPRSPQEKPDALLPTMGGQTALNLAVALAEVRLSPHAPNPSPEHAALA